MSPTPTAGPGAPQSPRISSVKSPFPGVPPFRLARLSGDDWYIPKFIEATTRSAPNSYERLPGRVIPAMAVNLGDPKKKELFGKLIESYGDEGKQVAGRFMSMLENPGAMSDADENGLTFYREEFMRRSMVLEDVRSDITDTDLGTCSTMHLHFVSSGTI